MQNILPKYLKSLERNIHSIFHFSDVFSENNIDFDAELTVRFRSLGRLSDLTFPIGQNPQKADYAAVLINDLLLEQKRIIEKIREQHPRHPLQENLIQIEKEAPIMLINAAPRDSKTTANGQNGEDFHLAITTQGLEIYTVPLARLASLEARNQILALYRISTLKHPYFNGQREQFRSSIIATTRFCPQILETVFQYETEEELLKAKLDGTHPKAIPDLTAEIEIAFTDKFGNVRLQVKDPQKLLSKLPALGQKILINQKIEATYTTSLAELKEGELGLYYNIADQYNSHLPCYFELVKKTSKPNHETITAANLVQDIQSISRKD